MPVYTVPRGFILCKVLLKYCNYFKDTNKLRDLRTRSLWWTV